MSPAAPTPAAVETPAGTLVIRVLARNSEQPIPGAHISTPTAKRSTDASGVCTLTVVAGQELDVDVSAPGYEPMGASAVVGANERWTFYLSTLP